MARRKSSRILPPKPSSKPPLPDIRRFRAYIATAPEDYERRATMALTDDEVRALHAAGWEGPNLPPLLHEVICVRRADEIFQRWGKREEIPLGVWIQTTREVLKSVEIRPFTRGSERGREAEYGYALPWASVFSRKIDNPAGGAKYELEIAFQTDAFPLGFDLQTKSGAWKERFVRDSIRACQ